jgi:hypothetical protein
MRSRSIISQVRITKNLQLPFPFGKYRYYPLPTTTGIRLLELAPTVENNLIRCSLKTIELQNAPSFKALSYTWGDSHVKISSIPYDTPKRDNQSNACLGANKDGTGRWRKHPIICDGCLIKVTSNLRDALRMLANVISMPQMSKTPNYYGIDALCI